MPICARSRRGTSLTWAKSESGSREEPGIAGNRIADCPYREHYSVGSGRDEPFWSGFSRRDSGVDDWRTVITDDKAYRWWFESGMAFSIVDHTESEKPEKATELQLTTESRSFTDSIRNVACPKASWIHRAGILAD
jgi:hypothetical protein